MPGSAADCGGEGHAGSVRHDGRGCCDCAVVQAGVGVSGRRMRMLPGAVSLSLFVRVLLDRVASHKGEFNQYN